MSLLQTTLAHVIIGYVRDVDTQCVEKTPMRGLNNIVIIEEI